DKNIHPANRHFRQLVARLADHSDTGLHPSYASNLNPTLLDKEVETLAGMTGKPVVCSRQHYLKIRFPETYRNLIRAGIREDFSLGFADRAGFRAGIANPFRHFDLRENIPTQLTVYPFQVMDTTLRHYMQLDPIQAISLIRRIIDTTREVGGTFISLWHNESLSEWKTWRGWSRVYREMLAYASGSKQ
ncbi:MAG: polysaccharide deacetylase family protein, partial [Bacteroidales bacterium]